MGKEIADGRYALASIFLAVLVCLFTGSFQRLIRSFSGSSQ